MATHTSSGSGASNSPFNRTAQHDAKRIAILSQAARLFNYKGSRATTLQDIADSLGLSKTSLYYYVKTKEELIFQCYMAALDHHHSRLDVIEREHETPIERIRAFFLCHFEDWQAAQTGRAPHWAVLLEIAALPAPHRETVEARYIEMFKRLREYIRQGIAEGSLRSCEPTSVVLAILGSLDWTFSWLQQIPPDQIQDVAAEGFDLIAHGLCAGPSTHPPAPDLTAWIAGVPLPGFNREEQNRLKQQAFFKTGIWYFNKKGFNGTSLDEIAEHLHVSKGAFYYHIKNKEDLLYNCYKHSLNISESIHAFAAAQTGTGMQKVEIACRHMFYVQNSEEGPLIRYNSITALPLQKRLSILERTEKVNQRFGELLLEGQADGSVRPVNTFVAQHMVTGAINAAMEIDRWRRVESIETASTQYFDVFFNGLLPR